MLRLGSKLATALLNLKVFLLLRFFLPLCSHSHTGEDAAAAN